MAVRQYNGIWFGPPRCPRLTAAVMSDNVNWNLELRKISREYSGLPPEPTAEDVRRMRLEDEAARRRNAEQAAGAGVWIRLTLVALLAGALNYWPYSRDCGPGLYGFLAAEAVFTLGAIWVATATWRCRMGKTHLLALLMMLAGLGLIELQVLPRTGYAAVRLPMRCGARD